MKKCKCEHWQTCLVCYPQGFDEAGNRKPVEIPQTRGEMLARIKELEAERDALAIVIQKMRDGITTCLAYKATPSSELLKIGYDTTTIIKRHDAAVLRKAADTTLSEQSVLLDGMHGYTALKIQGLMIESLHLKADELEKS